MRRLIKNRNFWLILSIDTLLLGAAYFLSYFIRFEGEIPPEAILNIKHTIWLTIPFKLIVFVEAFFGIFLSHEVIMLRLYYF